jgi:hypothetical protein
MDMRQDEGTRIITNIENLVEIKTLYVHYKCS